MVLPRSCQSLAFYAHEMVAWSEQGNKIGDGAGGQCFFLGCASLVLGYDG